MNLLSAGTMGGIRLLRGDGECKRVLCLSGRRLLLATAAVILMVIGIGMPELARAQSVPIVFSNDTGMSSSQIWIQFLGGHAVDGTYTDAITGVQQLQGNTAYSLDQLTNPATGKAQINLSAVDSGRVYVSYGAYGLQNLGADNGGYTPSAQTITDPNYGTRYQYWEPTVKPAGGGATIWADLTYIDMTAISFSMSARNTSDNKLNAAISNGNQTSSFGQVLVNKAWSSSTNSPQAIMPSGASTTLPNSTFARVISPQFSSAGTYPDFTNYLNHLGNASTTATISGQFVGTVPETSTLDDKQIYNYLATFSGNATTGQVTLTAQSGSVQTNTIVIKNSDLNSALGIYGNDVPYSFSISGNLTAPTKGITNDVYGRIVGDLLAGLSFGYVGSTVTYTSGNLTKTIGQVSSTEWWAGGETQGPVLIGAGGNATVAWLDTPAGKGIYFGGAQPLNSDYYNQYAASLAATDPVTGKPYTTGYGFPLQDRLGNNLLVYNTAENPGTYLLLSINPDGSSALPTAIWTGNATSGLWQTSTNWQGNAVPGANASVQFVGSSGQTTTVDTGGNQSVSGIYFNYASGNFTIANNTITLTGDIVNSSHLHYLETISSNLVLGSNSTVTAAFGDLALGTIALSNNATSHVLTFAGTQNSTVSGVISDGTAAGSLVKTGNGTLTLSGNNTFSGGFAHQTGTVILGDSHAAGTGTLSLGKAAAADAILQATGGPLTMSNALTIAGNTTMSGSQGFAFTGPVTLTSSTIPLGNSTTTFNNFTVTNSVDVAFSGAIGQSGPGSGSSFTKAGAGNMTFSGSSANTFNGTLSVNDGTLFLNKSSGAAYGGSLIVGAGTGTAGSAVVELKANNQTPGTDITIGTDGKLDLQSFNATAGNLTMTGGSITGSGSLAISNSSLVTFSGTGNSSALISSSVLLNDLSSGGSGTFTFTTNNNAANVQMLFSGVVSGGNATTHGSTLAKTQSGTLQFAQDSTFDGGVAINGGVMATANMANSSVTINAGALSPGGVGTVKAISVANLYASQDSAQIGSFLMDLGATGSSDSVQSLGIVALGDATTFIFSAAAGFAGSGNYTLINGTGVTAYTGYSAYNIVSLGIAGLTGNFHVSADTKSLYFLALAGQTATWNGTTTDWGTGGNWNPTSVPLSGADIIFNGGGNSEVATGADRMTGAITFTGSQSYTISDHTIVLGGNLVNNSTVTQTIDSNIALNYSRTISASTGNLSFGGNVALSNVGALPSVLTFAGDQNTSVIGAISDGPAAGGSVVKTGNGLLTLAGNNTFTGSLAISGGVVAANSGYALGAGEGGEGITQGANTLIFSGGTLQATGTIVSANGRYLDMQSTGIIDTNGNSVTINGAIQGVGGLTKNGTGSLTLNPTGDIAVNSYAGATTINGGSLIMGSAGVLGSASAGTTVNSGASLVISSQFDVVGESLSLAGTGDGGNGALHLSGGIQSSWNGTITLSGSSSIQADASAILTLNQVVMGANNLTFTGSNATINLAATLTGSGSLTMNATGSTLNILGTNTGFTGPATTVQSGTLSVQNSFALGNATSSLTVASGGTIQFQSGSDLNVGFTTIALNGAGAGGLGAITNNSESTTLSGNIALGGNTLINSVSGNLILTGNISAAGNALTVVNTGTQMTLSGGISGGGGSLTANGTGSILLSGANSYGGGTAINSGVTLIAASNSALGSGSISVVSGATLQLQGGIALGTGNLGLAGTGANAAGALRNFSGNNTIGGVVTVSGGTSQINSSNGTLTFLQDFTTSNPLTLVAETSTAGIAFSGNVDAGNNLYTQGSGAVSIGGNLTLGGLLTLGSTGQTTVSGSLLGSNNLVQVGSGNTTIAGGLSSFNGTITVDAGSLSLASTAGYNKTITVQGNATTGAPATVSMNATGFINQVSVQPSGVLALSGNSSGTSVSLTQGTLKLSNPSPTSYLFAGFSSTNGIIQMGLGSNQAQSDSITQNAPSLGGSLAFHFLDNGISTGSYNLISSVGGGIGGGLAASNVSFTSNSTQQIYGYFSLDTAAGGSLVFHATLGAAQYIAATGAWDNTANWQGGFVPADGSSVSFSGNATTSSVDTVRDRSVGSMTFDSGEGSFTIANHIISIYGGVTNNSTNTQTISSALILASDVTVSAASGNLVLSGNVSLSDGTTTRTLTGTGCQTTTVTGVISNGNATTASLVKSGSGTLVLTGVNTFAGTTTVSAGQLLVNGSLASSNAVAVSSNGTLAGSGTVAGQVTVAGTIAPGNNTVGSLSTGSQVWQNGGALNWRIYNATGAAGSGYSTMAVTGSLSLTQLTSGQFSVNLWSLDGLAPDHNGLVSNFDNTNSYSWTLLTTTAGITGFNAADFTVYSAANNGAAGFSNPLGGGTFTVGLNGNDLMLNYSPAPEPSTWILLVVSLSAFILYSRLRRKTAKP